MGVIGIVPGGKVKLALFVSVLECLLGIARADSGSPVLTYDVATAFPDGQSNCLPTPITAKRFVFVKGYCISRRNIGKVFPLSLQSRIGKDRNKQGHQ